VSHLFLTESGFEDALVDELAPASVRSIGAGILTSDAVLTNSTYLAFAQQTLPVARPTEAVSINHWADQIIECVLPSLPDEQPWRLHVWPEYGEGRAGINRCQLIRAAVVERMKKRRRRLTRLLQDDLLPMDSQTSLVQCFLTAPDAGWISVCIAPQPQDLRAIVSRFPRGIVPLAEDRSAPSRAFAKLIEAESHLGRQIAEGEICVDLGASPGSWSYVALQRGAEVIAIDRSELRDDLMHHPHLRFEVADAFKFKPTTVVDWLVCDVIAAPQRSIDLLLEWLHESRMRHFVVTIKFKGTDDYGVLDQLKKQAAPKCAQFGLKRLCANKNEVCAFGTL
jgi:23S rRNA (cytidine2498-2'-O)-methyltransferase